MLSLIEILYIKFRLFLSLFFCYISFGVRILGVGFWNESKIASSLWMKLSGLDEISYRDVLAMFDFTSVRLDEGGFMTDDWPVWF
jgi:hypothetical protein